MVDYHDYIKSPEWKLKADAMKWIAGNRCQVCNGNGQLDCHHRTYERLGDERPEDLTVLCRECHEVYHNAHTIREKQVFNSFPYWLGDKLVVINPSIAATIDLAERLTLTKNLLTLEFSTHSEYEYFMTLAPALETSLKAQLGSKFKVMALWGIEKTLLKY